MWEQKQKPHKIKGIYHVIQLPLCSKFNHMLSISTKHHLSCAMMLHMYHVASWWDKYHPLRKLPTPFHLVCEQNVKFRYKGFCERTSYMVATYIASW